MTASARRVLVADDSATVRRAATALLSASGYEVVTARDGEEAFAVALAEPFDVVVTDMTMGSVSGVHLCRLLRATPSTADVPIIILTASDHPRERFWSRHAGADRYVEKRAMQAELPDAVALLSRRARSPSAGPTVRATPFERLAGLMDTMLFSAIVSAEAHRLVRHIDDRALLARELLLLAAGLVDTRYLVLQLGAGDSRSVTVHARGAWPRDGSESLLRGLGVDDPSSADVLLDERESDRPPGVGEPSSFPIVLSEEVLGGITAFTDRGALTQRDSETLVQLARDSALVIKTASLAEAARATARTDALTALANRRAADERLAHEIERARRQQAPFSIALCDLDRFKSINDTHGHASGDDVLKRTAASIVASLRRSDAVARWGGEEIVLLLPNTDAAGAARAVEKALEDVRALRFTGKDGAAFSVTFSAGVVLAGASESLDEAVARADTLLYAAKAAGRDRVLAG